MDRKTCLRQKFMKWYNLLDREAVLKVSIMNRILTQILMNTTLKPKK